MSDILHEARKALKIEMAGLAGLLQRLDESFVTAVEMILACRGKVVVTGMGKSGHIAQKIAGTLTSTGTQATFLHPAEAPHGDMGIVSKDDLMLAISNSGATEEVIKLLGPMRRIGVPWIAMTGDPASELAKRAEVHLDVSVAEEACPHNLAPTASTTAALALGDALAVCLLLEKGFSKEDYYVFHRSGSLGKKLVTRVQDLMDTGAKVPIVRGTDPVRQVIGELQKKRYGLTAVVDGAGALAGVFSMGDFTRLHLDDGSGSFMERPVSEFTGTEPRTTSPDALAARALHTMEKHNIRALFVVDEAARPIGIIGLYEVLKAIDY